MCTIGPTRYQVSTMVPRNRRHSSSNMFEPDPRPGRSSLLCAVLQQYPISIAVVLVQQ